MIEEILDEVRRIDWEEYWTVFGPATRVPRQIEGLTSADPQVADDASWDMFVTVIHQYDVMPCWLVIAPFLIRLLQEPAVVHKAAILEILAAFMAGREWYLAHSASSEESLEEIDETDEAGEAEDPRTILAELYTIVRAGLPTYLQLLANMPRPVPPILLELLGLLPADADTVAPALWQYYRQQRDPEVLRQLQELVEGQPEYYPGFEDVLMHDPDPEARLTAAICLAYLQKDQTHTRAVDLLTTQAAPATINWRLLHALSMIPIERGVPRLLWHLSQMKDADNAHSVVKEILAAIFPDEIKPPFTGHGDPLNGETYYVSPSGRPKPAPPRQRATLSEWQERALRALVESDQAWTMRTDLWRLYGLPNTREQLRAFLDQ
ncbi:MAG TPA: hypothetical protein VFM49_03345 [Chloroflexia bacterium]|jgi:hypothetical protein|nr:hypothetical protein [Chloroflexia bacterium]